MPTVLRYPFIHRYLNDTRSIPATWKSSGGHIALCKLMWTPKLNLERGELPLSAPRLSTYDCYVYIFNAIERYQ